MNLKKTFTFLRQLAAHNNREWFNSHKADYEAAKSEFDALLTVLIAHISLFEPEVMHLEAKDCVYRIYRDLRFSQDKTPYKTHFGGFISARGKKSLHCGYYVHVEPGNSMLAGGGWCPTSPMLRAIRQSVVDNIDEFRDIVEAPDFKHYYPTVGWERLKTAPKDFPKDFPYMQYLQPKDYIVWHQVSDEFFSAPDMVDTIVDAFKQMKPYNDFLNYTIDDYI